MENDKAEAIEKAIREIDELLAQRQGFNHAYREWKQSAFEELRSALGDEIADELEQKGPRQTPINRQHRIHLYRQRLHAQQKYLQELLDAGNGA